MRNPIQRATKALAAALAAGTLTACGGIGMGGYPAPDAPRETPGTDETLKGAVVQVDERREEIVLRDEDGDNRFVLYDPGATPVWYEGKRYEVENLEPGDLVEARLGGDRYGNRVATEIRVLESRQDRYGESAPPDPRDDRREVVGEVVAMDSRRSEIEIRDAHGADRIVPYDDDTPVWYQGRRYAVDALEPGDYVEARLGEDRYGERVATEIRVLESRQDRAGTGRHAPDPGEGRIERLAGTVTHVDRRRGEFSLRARSGDTVVVRMPYEAGDENRRVFSRLDIGDFVQAVAEAEGDGHYHLVTFERHDG